MSNNEVIYKSPQDIDYEAVAQRRQRRAARMGLLVNILAFILTLIALTIVIRAMIARFPLYQPLYTANAESVCAFAPVSERGHVTDALVRDFAQSAAVDFHTLDYMNWRKTIDNVTASRFTPTARVEAADNLNTSGILPSLINNRFVLKPVVSDLVEIINERVNEAGAYEWKVSVPMILAYTGAGEAGTTSYRPEARTITLTVERVPVTADNPQGLKVSSLFSSQTVK